MQLQHTNELMMQQGHDSGFQFDHVWLLLKGYVQGESITEDSEKNILELSNPSLSSSNNINLSSGENISTSESTYQRLRSVKRSKLKRKQHEGATMLANKYQEKINKLREVLRDLLA